MVAHSPRAFPWEIKPPVGIGHVTGKRRRRARGRRSRPRICLRKGCRRKYRPRCHNQRSCQDPECLRKVRRWHAARRKARHRRDVDVKIKHAQEEKAHRQLAKSASQTVENPKLARRVVTQLKLLSHFPYAIGRAATNTALVCPAISNARNSRATAMLEDEFSFSKELGPCVVENRVRSRSLLTIYRSFNKSQTARSGLGIKSGVPASSWGSPMEPGLNSWPS